MKKLISIFMVLALLLSFAACSNNKNPEGESSTPQQSSTPNSTPAEEANSQNDFSSSTKTDSKSLVSYI